MLYFSTVVAPTVIFAATNEQHQFHDVDGLQPSQQRQRWHLAQEQLISDFGSNSLLSSWQKIEPSQPVKQGLQIMGYMESKKLQDQEVSTVTALSRSTKMVPGARIRSHPTQSDLVQRFVTFFTPFSMSTSYAACQQSEDKGVYLGRWFN